MLKNEENEVENIIRLELRLMKRYKIFNTELDKLFTIYK